MKQYYITPELIQRYLQGRCSATEEAQVNEWFNSFEEVPDLLQFLNQLEQKELDEKMLARIRSRIELAEGVQLEETSRQIPLSPGKNHYRRTILVAVSSIAAAVILVFGIGLYWQQARKSVIGQGWTQTTAPIVVVNQTASLLKQTLEDGSVVWLYPGSRIDYPKAFATHTRQVELAGEAFFEVTKNPERPFIIRSGKLLTTVIGTSFSIKAHENAASAEVVVVTGKVSVQLLDQASPLNEVLLTQYQKATYVKTEKRLSRQNVNPKARRNMWEESNLSFDDATVKEIIEGLNQYFDVKIDVANKNVLQCRLHVDFNGYNLPAILEMLGQSIEVSYEINDKEILLKGEGCIR